MKYLPNALLFTRGIDANHVQIMLFFVDTTIRKRFVIFTIHVGISNSAEIPLLWAKKITEISHVVV